MNKAHYIIGLDLGTKCGWAVLGNGVLTPVGKRIASGTWNFSPKRHEGGGMRYVRFANKLRELLDKWSFDISPQGTSVHVAFEEVRRHRGVTAAHVYGGLMATLQSVLEDRETKIPYVSIPVGTIKKHATGKGNASKEQMMTSAKKQWEDEGWELQDDNEADALWVASAYLNGLF